MLALADMELSNKAGHIANVRFKLDSDSGANLLPLHAYLSFPQKRLSELGKTVDKNVRLVAAAIGL